MKGLDVAKVRADMGLTQQEFGELIGVDRRTVINYEQGKVIPISKVKLLDLLMSNGAISTSGKTKSQNTQSKSVSNNIDLDILEREIIDLKDHIKTLKELVDEKNKLADMYQRENSFLIEKINSLEDRLK
jgi:transcriptional regulator with XRE-family HTH domain